MLITTVLPQDLRTAASPTFAGLTDSGLTATRIIFAGAAGLLSDSENLTYDGTTLALGAGKLIQWSAASGNNVLYSFDSGSQSIISFRNITSAKGQFVQFLPNDLDGTDNLVFRLISKAWTAGPVYGTAGIDVNDVRLVVRYVSTGSHEIFSGITGAGTVIPLKIYCGIFTNQIHLAVDGKVGIGRAPTTYQLEVAGTVYGISSSSFGIYGISTSGYGVSGTSSSNYGVYGFSNTGNGVHGVSGSQYGVYGASTSNYSIYSAGTVYSVGLLTANGGVKIIDGSNLEKTVSDLTITTASQKTVVLSRPVYKDINISGALLSKPVSSAPGTDTFRTSTPADTGIETYAFAVGEKVHGCFELQHDYKEGTDLTFHVHWQGIAAPAGGTDNVQWRLTYIVARDGVTLTTVTTIDSPDVAIDTQYRFYRNDFGAITGTNFKIGDQFAFTLERVAAVSDDYAGDCLIATAGIHYQVDTIGSRQIGIK